MQSSSHLTIGAITATICSKYEIINSDSIDILLLILGSILPDIDHPRSIVGSRAWFISKSISRSFGHRGITHSFLGMALVFLPLHLFNLPDQYIVSLMIGYLTHLFADWLTPAGIPLLYPAKIKFRSPVTVVTGGNGERLIVWLLTVSFLGLVLSWFDFYSRLIDTINFWFRV